MENQGSWFSRTLHDPYEPCFTQFFVNGQPPFGLRNNLNPIKYICQQIPGSHRVFYGTLFDGDAGIAVYSAYKLAANFDGNGAGQARWHQEPGILSETTK